MADAAINIILIAAEISNLIVFFLYNNSPSVDIIQLDKTCTHYYSYTAATVIICVEKTIPITLSNRIS